MKMKKKKKKKKKKKEKKKKKTTERVEVREGRLILRKKRRYVCNKCRTV